VSAPRLIIVALIGSAPVAAEAQDLPSIRGGTLQAGEQASPADAPTPPADRTNTWIALGLAGAAAAGASLYGAMALAAFNGTPKFERAAPIARNNAQTANVLWTVAGVAAGGAVVLFVLEL
jgi:hypothetical protein